MADNSSYFTSDPSPPGSRSAASPPERDLLKGRGTDPDQPPEGEVTTTRAGRSTTARLHLGNLLHRERRWLRQPREDHLHRRTAGRVQRQEPALATAPEALRHLPAGQERCSPRQQCRRRRRRPRTRTRSKPPLSHLDDHPGILQQQAPRPNLY